jgi:hypothetical protein
LIYFIGQNIHLTSLALHEKWWNSAMTGYLTWLAAGGFNAPVAEEMKSSSCPADEKKAESPPIAKGRTSKVKAKAVKAPSIRQLETSDHA